MYDDEDAAISAEIDRLILEGAMTPDHLDDDGDMVYTFNMEKLKEVSPMLYEEQMKEVSQSVDRLFELGLIEATGLTDDGEATYNLTEEGVRFFDEFFSQ